MVIERAITLKIYGTTFESNSIDKNAVFLDQISILI